MWEEAELVSKKVNKKVMSVMRLNKKVVKVCYINNL